MDPQSDASYGYDQPNVNPPAYVNERSQQPPQQVVVSTQPTQVIMIQPTPLVNPPSDGLAFAIFVTMCCCLPLGIFAIISSSQCRSAVMQGNRAEAEKLSKKTRSINWAGVAIGLAFIVVTVLVNVIALSDDPEMNGSMP